MGKLTIYWGDQSSETFRWYLDTEKASGIAVPDLESQSILKADLACLADMAENNRVELVISANDVHLANVDVPGKAQRHLRKAVPYMLEEQIADSVDDVFIAIGERQSDGKIPVRGIRQAYIEQLIEQFKLSEIKLDAIVTDLDCLESGRLNSGGLSSGRLGASHTDSERLETAEDEVIILLEGNRVLVASAGQISWMCDAEDFNWLIQKQLSSAESDEEISIAVPLKIISDNETASKVFEQNLPAGRFASSIVLVEDVIEHLCNQSSQAINLLQAEFEPKAESSALQKLIKNIATVAALVLVVHIVFQGSQWFSLSAKADALEAQKEAMWKQAFPGRKMPKSANRQIKSALKSISGAGGDSAFLSMLDEVTAKITNLDELYPTNVSFDVARNEMRLDLIGKEYATLNQYRDTLVSAGYKVEMNSATQRGDAYSSRFIVKK